MTTGRRRADSPGEDELLSRLYQHVTEQQAARFAAGYDMAAGLGRYRAWLGEHTAGEQATPQEIPVAVPAALRAAFAGSGAGIVMAGTLLAGAPLEPVPAEWDAARAVTAIYTAHYRSLVRLAALLLRDVATAQEIVQDSFIALHAAWPRLRDGEKALSYLRQSVVNRSRSVLRHRVVADRNAPQPPPDRPSAGQGAIWLPERSAVIAALRTLPTRQREALVLKYYADLPDTQIAAAMGISKGAVKSHTARAVATLRTVLEIET